MPARIKSLSKILFSILILICSINTFGQGTTGSVEGTVVDPIGAPVAGASVTIENKNDAAGFKKTVTTNEKGEFTINEIPLEKSRCFITTFFRLLGLFKIHLLHQSDKTRLRA